MKVKIVKGQKISGSGKFNVNPDKLKGLIGSNITGSKNVKDEQEPQSGELESASETKGLIDADVAGGMEDTINVEGEVDLEGVAKHCIDNWGVIQEEKRKSIVVKNEEKRKNSEQRHEQVMEKKRFDEERAPNRKTRYQLRQEEKRKTMMLEEEQRRRAAELEHQLALEKQRQKTKRGIMIAAAVVVGMLLITAVSKLLGLA